MEKFKHLVTAGLAATAINAAADPPHAIKRGLTAPDVKSGTMSKAANPNEVPRLFPHVKLPEFTPVVPDSDGKPSDALLGAMLKASSVNGYSPGLRLAFAEMETAGTYDPLAHASRSKRDKNGRIVGIEKSGSAAGTSMFIEDTFDRIINQNGEEILREAGGPKNGAPLQGNSIFADPHFTDQQIIEIMRTHSGRDAYRSGDMKNLPMRGGSDELMALRSNPLIDQLAGDKLRDEAVQLGTAMGVSITPATLYQYHLFGGLPLSAALQKGNGKNASSDLFSSGVVGANKHMFEQGGEAMLVHQTLAKIEGEITGRAAMLERKFLGTTFTPNAADDKRDNAPRDFEAPNGQTVKIAPKLIIQHKTLPEYIAARERTRIEEDAYDVVKKSGDNAKAAQLSNQDARAGIEIALENMGFLKGKKTFAEAVTDYRDAAGLPSPRNPEFFDSSFVASIAQSSRNLRAIAELQAQQAKPAAAAGKGSSAAMPAAGAVDLRDMQRKMGSSATSADEKQGMRRQVMELRADLIEKGLLSRPTERVKEEFTDGRGRKRSRFVNQPRELDEKRDGNVDNNLLRSVEKAQSERGLKPTAVVDPVTRAALAKPPLAVANYQMKIPVPSTKKVSAAPETQKVMQMAALAGHFHPGEDTPLAGFIQQQLSSVTVHSGPSAMFQAVGTLKHAEPTSFGMVSIAPLAGEVQMVDMSGMTRLFEAGTEPVAPPSTRPAPGPRLG